MADFTIILGNKNYSSWSLRPWLALKQTGADFREVVVPLDRPETREQIARFSPAGRVPILKHGEVTVWDSLAICEYLNELYPGARLWPAEAERRAAARAVSAEMHSGFAALRENCTMNLRLVKAGHQLTPQARADSERIREIWRDCRKQHGAGGRFLFGDFTIADCMFAPVVTRFHTYDVKLDGKEAAYASAVWEWPAFQEWLAAARLGPCAKRRVGREEPWTIGKYEPSRS